MKIINRALLVCFFLFKVSNCLPDEGKWNEILNLGGASNIPISHSKSLYKDAEVNIKINCDSKTDNIKIKLTVAIVQSRCWNKNDALAEVDELFSMNTPIHDNKSKMYLQKKTYDCNDHIVLPQGTVDNEKAVYVFPSDGVYVLAIMGEFENGVVSNETSFRIFTEIKSDYGYLSAADWPLLPFYGFMCIYYIILGVIWLILSFLQWRDLLRIQFWIGGVILLGMLEKATFYAEYQSINNMGTRSQGAMLFAEWVSCAKRTLARMLVVIVSLGFGIVKPRLGSTLHRVVGVGLLYFFLAASESYLRIMRDNNDANKNGLVAAVPLAVLDSAICWWIFSALVNTTRTLRLRRNETKLSLYRHFTNTLIFSVIASVFFMLYCIKVHHYVQCLTVWKDIWLEEAYWHILFSFLLLIIMILWRPTNNNQRYAFVPLLDTGNDDDEEEEHLVNDAYGVKVRIHHNKQTTPPRQSVEDDLKWLEENVKSDPALPILDSDEEIVNTRFEVSKMQ